MNELDDLEEADRRGHGRRGDVPTGRGRRLCEVVRWIGPRDSEEPAAVVDVVDLGAEEGQGQVGVAAELKHGLAHAILPGLRTTDDRTFVGAFQSIDEAITNPLFLATFVGVLVVTGVAAVLHLRQDGRSVLPWTVAAFILYLAVFVITVRVTVPLNDEIKDAGDPDRIADLAAVREWFDEAKWVRWNIVRAVMSTAAFGCLTWALVLYGRVATQPALTPGTSERGVPSRT